MEEASPPPPAPTGVVGGVPGGVPGAQMGGVIGGIASGSGGGIGAGKGPGFGPAVAEVPAAAPSELEEGFRLPDATEIADSLESGTTVGQSQEVGDLFEYKLQDRVTIRKNQSALVPILQSRIDAEKVSVWNPSDSSVLRALWIDNTTKLTIDGGS